jgi:hypothetical protein
MIGVLAKSGETKAVEEFFQLFKTQWEFWRRGHTYDVVIATCDDVADDLGTPVLIWFGSHATVRDQHLEVRTKSGSAGAWMEWHAGDFPVYGEVAVLEASADTVLMRRRGGGIVAVARQSGKRTMVRIGFDLFSEVAFLLRRGQPRENAHIPTLDRHIAFLREVLLSQEVPFVEVLPVPPGYDFMACLTHDVDFVGLRDHEFDHTMWGFLYRCFVSSLTDSMRGRLSWSKCLRNWAAGLSLPLVFAGLRDDFWLEFDRYTEIEREFGSTFFFIPFPNSAGTLGDDPAPRRRAARYDVAKIRHHLLKLLSDGCEVGVHGIDAWRDVRRARAELQRIQELTGVSELGTRMHWLYWAEDSAQVLEEAGFAYDSTFGYNDAVGFRAGTTQPFCPLDAIRLLELPLTIQDSALFYRDRMNLSEAQALAACKDLIDSAVTAGGAITVNWHTRSLSPERLWGDFYAALLRELQAHRVWFGTARQTVAWFRERRALRFESVQLDASGARVVLTNGTGVPDSSFTVRFHGCGTYNDAVWAGEEQLSIPHPEFAV